MARLCGWLRDRKVVQSIILGEHVAKLRVDWGMLKQRRRPTGRHVTLRNTSHAHVCLLLLLLLQCMELLGHLCLLEGFLRFLVLNLQQ